MGLPAPRGVKLLEHTADMGLALRGPDVETVFRRSLDGLLLLLGLGQGCGDGRELRLQISAPDNASLLVAWLNELLFHIQARQFRPCAITILHIKSGTLSAMITGSSGQDSTTPAREVKAATYHRLRFAKVGGSYRARVYFDL